MIHWTNGMVGIKVYMKVKILQQTNKHNIINLQYHNK